MQCFRRASTGLALVRQLGRPGVLTLVDASGQRGFALLTALSDRGATLVTASGQHSVPLSVLASAWRGDFATFWRVPTGPRAQALAVQLATLDGAPAPAASTPVTEAVLRPRVHAFQVAQGLVPDGVAGPITQMQLNRATGVDEPRLLAER